MPLAQTPQQPIKLDPFFKVRTPGRNYGQAKLSGGIAVTPLARRLAGEAGIDLSRLRGSGPHGRIVARDVESAPRPAAHGPAALAEGPSADQVKALFDPAGYVEVPLDGMRRTIAARLPQAKQTIPHFYLTADLTIDRLIAVREEANAAAPRDKRRQSGVQIIAQRFRHPRAGSGAATCAGGECRVGRRPHSAFQAFRYRRRGGARRRTDHARSFAVPRQNRSAPFRPK